MNQPLTTQTFRIDKESKKKWLSHNDTSEIIRRILTKYSYKELKELSK